MSKTISKSILLLFLSISFFACSEDEGPGSDEGESANSSEIVGTWDVTKYETNNMKVSYSVSNQNFEIVQKQTGRDFDYQVTFTEDGKVTASGGYMVDYSYDFAGQPVVGSIPLTSSDLPLSLSTYETSGSEITITYDDGSSQTAKIKSLTNGVLTLELDLSQGTIGAIDVPGSSGFDMSVTGTAELVLVKQ